MNATLPLAAPSLWELAAETIAVKIRWFGLLIGVRSAIGFSWYGFRLGV